MKKVGRNDPCPCGSGEKYKNCCGSALNVEDKNLNKPCQSDLALEDFVIDRLSEDAFFIANAIQLILGPYGYSYFEKYSNEIIDDYKNNGLEKTVGNDAFSVYSTTRNKKRTLKKIKSFAGDNPEDNQDLLVLLKQGYVTGYQIEILHKYLMNNLKMRFKDYYYVPTERSKEDHCFGAFARRGYDFLLAITLYAELQLGVHTYLLVARDEVEPLMAEHAEYVEERIHAFYGTDGKQIKYGYGMAEFLLGYADVIMKIEKEYNPTEEVNAYYSAGIFSEKEYEERLQSIQPEFYPSPLHYDYILYLKMLVLATITNTSDVYNRTNMAFPQCDFIRYLFGVEKVIELFEDKLQGKTYKTEDVSQDIKQIVEESGGEIKDVKISRKELYDELVFLWMDNINTIYNHYKHKELEYIDFPNDPNDDEQTVINGMHLINPARRTTRISPPRSLVMDLYNLFNGKSFELRCGDKPGSFDEMKVVGKYPILPRISNGKEKTIHISPFDKTPMEVSQLCSFDIGERQKFLNMEYRLTSIPVNAIDRYLDPEAFKVWEERNKLLEEVEEQNENLKRQIETNHKLVRNIAHSAANYLNSDRLGKTGVQLHTAENGNPTLEELHSDGLLLMLQSEQEKHLTRQLKGLVRRYQSDQTESEIKAKADVIDSGIRTSISKTEGVDIDEIIAFALKTVIARILFSDSDSKGEEIRKKARVNEIEWTNSKSTFITEVLAKDEDSGAVYNWCKDNLVDISVKISDMWKKIKIKKNGDFDDLITEIVTELLINAMVHGKVDECICLELGQENKENGRPKCAYISVKNKYEKKRSKMGYGLTSLDNSMSLINGNKQSLECIEEGDMFETKVWIDRRFFIC